MIIDSFTYNGEKEMLRLHLSMLSSYVDKFLIVEANQTFSGYKKPLYFFRDQRYVKPFWKKIEYFVVNDIENTEEIQKILKSFNIDTTPKLH